MKVRQRFVPYPLIEQHGEIGDRRTAILIAVDGTLGRLCVPAYDGMPYFGALLDAPGRPLAHGACRSYAGQAALLR